MPAGEPFVNKSRANKDYQLPRAIYPLIDITNPTFWLTSSGTHPDPFTIITVDDINNGTLRTTNPQMQSWATEYVQRLYDISGYPLCTWQYKRRISHE